MQFVDTAKQWHKKISTWLAGTLGTAVLTYSLLPEGIREAFPDWTLAALGLAVMFLVPTAVQIKQPALRSE